MNFKIVATHVTMLISVSTAIHAAELKPKILCTEQELYGKILDNCKLDPNENISKKIVYQNIHENAESNGDISIYNIQAMILAHLRDIEITPEKDTNNVLGSIVELLLRYLYIKIVDDITIFHTIYRQEGIYFSDHKPTHATLIMRKIDANKKQVPSCINQTLNSLLTKYHAISTNIILSFNILISSVVLKIINHMRHRTVNITAQQLYDELAQKYALSANKPEDQPYLKAFAESITATNSFKHSVSASSCLLLFDDMHDIWDALVTQSKITPDNAKVYITAAEFVKNKCDPTIWEMLSQD